jgi:lipopolysaccharide biosynthesis glycosyltransferase
LQNTIQPQKNAIVVCCTSNWLPLAACTLQSCAAQGGTECANFFVVTIDATEKQKSDFHEFASQHKFNATIINTTLSNALAEVPTQRLSPATLLRLTLDQHISCNYKKLLYLDCDVLALSPIASIFEFDLHGRLVGAVEDYESLPGPIGFIYNHLIKIGLGKNQSYFNSGVMLFDWPKTVASGLLPRTATTITHRYKSGLPMPLVDQDALNLEFAGKWQKLPMKYNLMAFFVDYFPQPAVFRHFSNKYKPWSNMWLPGFSAARQHYIKMLTNSPWPEFAKKRNLKIQLHESLAILFRRMDFVSRRRYANHLRREKSLN